MKKTKVESLYTACTHTSSLNNGKGITLIALVITIIILIILAGITISTLSDSGLFKNAKKARKETENAQNYENTILDEYLNEINAQVGMPTAQIKLESVTFGVKATITLSNPFIDFSKSKYIFNSSQENLGINEELYTEGNLTSEVTIIEKSKAAGTYYLHILLVNSNGEKKEYISSDSVVVASELDFDYTGSEQSVELLPGSYKLEVWGAQGGYRSNSSYGGRGGYSVGTLNLADSLTTLYAFVGGSGNTGKTSGGYNGGGARDTYNGGGGATDFRINSDSLYARVIVAGGGGSDGATNKTGLYGGGTSGGSATQNYGTGGQGANQTAAGGSSTNSADAGAFGIGGKGIYYSSGYAGAGGRRLVRRSRKLPGRFSEMMTVAVAEVLDMYIHLQLKQVIQVIVY